MYFFRLIVLLTIIVIASFSIYDYLTTKNTITKKNTILIYLALTQALITLFSNNMIFYVFLDFSCFLGYMLKRKREALVLSIINVIFLSMTIETPVFYYLIYFLYFIVDYVLTKNNKQSSTYLISIKAFLTSFIYFKYFEQNNLQLGYIIFILLYFYLLLEMAYHFFKTYEEKKNNNNLIFQVAHEVKNPLSVCKGYLDMLDTKNKEKVNKYIPIIKSEMSRALTIMDDFLNLKRITINKDIMDLMLLLDDVVATTETILKSKNITINLPLIEDEILLEADYDRLKQVFINLIKNSYEANSKNIDLNVTTKKDKVIIEVVDDGDGIEQKNLRKIGTIFYTTKVKGSGIGVSMSKEIIKLHDGDIKYESKVKEGTKVTVVLPYYVKF